MHAISHKALDQLGCPFNVGLGTDKKNAWRPWSPPVTTEDNRRIYGSTCLDITDDQVEKPHLPHKQLPTRLTTTEALSDSSHSHWSAVQSSSTQTVTTHHETVPRLCERCLFFLSWEHLAQASSDADAASVAGVHMSCYDYLCASCVYLDSHMWSICS
jgi:hypothetical protein